MEYEKHWRDYIKEIVRLKWNLEPKDQEKLDSILEELDALVTAATINNATK